MANATAKLSVTINGTATVIDEVALTDLATNAYSTGTINGAIAISKSLEYPIWVDPVTAINFITANTASSIASVTVHYIVDAYSQ